MTSPDPHDPAIPTNPTRLFASLAIIALIILSIVFVYQSLILPVSVSLFLTYLAAPLVTRIEKRVPIKRGLITFVLTFFIFGILILGISRLLPVLYRELVAIATLIPSAIRMGIDTVVPIVGNFIRSFNLSEFEVLIDQIKAFDYASQLGTQGTRAIERAWRATPTVLGGVIDVALIPIVSFFLLRDIDIFKQQIKRILPTDLVAPLKSLVQSFHETLSRVLVGQISVAMVLGAFYMIGFSVVGLRSAIAIGAIAGICRVVPYLDVVVGGGLAVIVILTDYQSWTQFALVGVVIASVQAIDGMFITPKVIGGRVGIHPLVVIVSVIAFGDWFGFWGVLLAIPIVASVKVLTDLILEYYLRSRLYSQK